MVFSLKRSEKQPRLSIAFIGGTGCEEFPLPIATKSVTIKTAAGRVELQRGEYRDSLVYFMLRHGPRHAAPHEINYRANALALSHIGAHAVLSSAAVGSLQSHHKPGDFLLLNDFIDATRSRPQTVLAGRGRTAGHRSIARHADMTEPYCQTLGRQILAAARTQNVMMKDQGVYLCTEGPRFETRAEITAYARLGGDVVGMTQVPEVVFARELGLCYAAIAIVTNMAAGLSSEPISAAEVVEMMRTKTPVIKGVFKNIVDWLVENPRTLLEPHH